MHIGLLTGGGDAPGLNAVIRGITVRARKNGHKVTGFLRGWKGAIENEYVELDLKRVGDIHMEGGTILLSSRTNPYKVENGIQSIEETYDEQDLDCLIAMGGEDTLGVANGLTKEGLNVIGVPKTIDNDLSATDFTFGFDTAINYVMKALDMLHTTARSHERVIVVEIMGRHAGWIALHGGMAGGAHVILTPEEEFDTDEVCRLLEKRYEEGNSYAIVAVAEGAIDQDLQRHVMHSAEKDAFGHVQLGTGIGIGEVLKNEIADRTDLETRHVILGHVQRGGSPTAFDRVLGTRLGVKAVEMAEQKEYGKMAALRGNSLIAVDLQEAVGTLKTVPKEQLETAKLFFG
ncbi:MAG: ATP-dependent 6-phosphofructokinase [Candidatus Aegiribacteria sp.]|nr:ATP-dependent 6-phosphofructokinase [Candidatus Aegiribacteria sp.]MBD3295300.1 ATP-dependent 6-phosphofructokinase [Candidatus Fermentibacteria bacterium]